MVPRWTGVDVELAPCEEFCEGWGGSDAERSVREEEVVGAKFEVERESWDGVGVAVEVVGVVERDGGDAT